MILISSAYIADYIIDDKYTYEELSFYNYTENQTELDKMDKDIKLNPFLNLSIGLKFNDYYAVRDTINEKFLKRDYIDFNKGQSIYNIRNKVSDIEIDIYYNCTDAYNDNCESFIDYINTYGHSPQGTFDISYQGFL